MSPSLFLFQPVAMTRTPAGVQPKAVDPRSGQHPTQTVNHPPPPPSLPLPSAPGRPQHPTGQSLGQPQQPFQNANQPEPPSPRLGPSPGLPFKLMNALSSQALKKQAQRGLPGVPARSPAPVPRVPLLQVNAAQPSPSPQLASPKTVQTNEGQTDTSAGRGQLKTQPEEAIPGSVPHERREKEIIVINPGADKVPAKPNAADAPTNAGHANASGDTSEGKTPKPEDNAAHAPAAPASS